MMGEGLLRMGRFDVARDFADWYGKYLFSNGKVPCCVDFRGADPVPENDSHGQYIFLLTELFRYTGDRAALDRDWPKTARHFMIRLSRLTAVFTIRCALPISNRILARLPTRLPLASMFADTCSDRCSTIWNGRLDTRSASVLFMLILKARNER